MTEFHWTENAEAVFEASLKAAPMGFRGVGRTGLEKGLAKVVGEGGEVHEADVVRAIRESTPAPFIGMGLKAAKPLMTDPSILDE
jgi:hypothetical protein